jgi:glycerol uptake facilitator-like aquaporin
MAQLARRLVAEALGTAFLLAAVVGSGITAERLAGGNGALALLCNTIPTGAILVVLILVFGPLSGAHFNPAVSLAFALKRELSWSCAAVSIVAQLAGAIAGVWAAHLMFELPLWQVATRVRAGIGQWLAEFIAAFGLLLTIFGCIARAPAATPYAVGLYITSALLVHGVDILRQSGGDHCALAIGHFRRHRAGRRVGVHRSPTCGSSRSGDARSMALGQEPCDR